MKNHLAFLSFLWIVSACKPTTSPDSGAVDLEVTERDTLVVLSNDSIRLTVSDFGGAFVGLELKSRPVNPLTWQLTPEQMPANNQAGAPFQGHFLCLGRWGSPSEGEMAAGVPHNGEPTNQWWKEVEKSDTHVLMEADAPLDGLHIWREVAMGSGNLFAVSERVKNTFSLGRPWNIVQHVTLGPPFLSPNLRVDTNAGRGFLQALSWPDPHRFAYTWPKGYLDSLKTPVDFTRSDVGAPYVTTHIFPKGIRWGWITAYQPEIGQVLGYLWPLTDYPWLNVWHQVENGQPVAKGLEFGTTGIGRPYQDLLLNDARFDGKYSYAYLDAGEEQTFRFYGFIAAVPTDFQGVAEVSVSESGEVSMKGRNGGTVALGAIKQP